MAERKSSNTTRSKKTTSRSSGTKRTTTSSSRGNAERRSNRSSASRVATSSRNYGRTSNYAAKKRRQEESIEMQRDIILVLLFAGMVFLFLSNFGMFGVVGSLFRNVMMGGFGAAAYILPVAVFALTLYGMMSSDDDGAGTRILCVIIMYIVLAVVCDLMTGEVSAEGSLDIAGIYRRCTENASGGGIVGGLLAWMFMHAVGLAGTVLILIVIAVICLVFITGKPLLHLMQDSAMDARDRARYRREAEDQYHEEHPEEYDDGFLPDAEDDDETDHDIAGYRARKAEEARAAREERLRAQARQDVERRHEARKQVYQTFRGIVGDTNLSNDPYVRRMTEEAAAREAAMMETGDDSDPWETSAASQPQMSREAEAMQTIGDTEDPDPHDTVPWRTSAAPAVQEPVVSEPAENAEPEDSARETDSTTVPVTEPQKETNRSQQELPLQEGSAEPAAPEVSGAVFAAQQLIRNQKPGTDGIQLAVVTGNVLDEEDFVTDRAAVQESVRQAIPIYRESNNLHEIHALEFQGGYAALARNTMQTDEDDEDLTTRIIRAGMAELEHAENHVAEEAPYGDARAAAASAFSRSTAFVETQDAYRRGDMQTAEVDDIPDRMTAVDMAAGTLDQTDHAECVDAVWNAAYETVPESTSGPNPEIVPESEATDALVADTGYETAAELGPECGQDDINEQETAADEIVTSEPVRTQETDPVREMTTPAGSGSVIAAEHARAAQIHSDNTEQDLSCEVSVSQERPDKAKSPVAVQPHSYVYPPLSLLTEGNPSRDSGSDEELRHTAEVLETTLHTFGVNCKITDISQGPAVTRYELLPEQGVKVSKVVGLSDDIKLALAAMDIRIEAPIPGKSAIGIEVPNKVTSMVALRDILSNANFRDHKSKLAIGVGKDISGQIVVSDLAKMPHVLIAGATGSGKSVCINTIIMSILYHASPEEVKLLMIDPKVVELSIYNGIPHLLYPVVTNPQQASTLLNWAVAEMESRYRRFADAQVRDMKGYNQMVQQQLDQGRTTDEDGNPYRIMPRIVVIVDELADLMMVAKNDVETAICRLAQLARAAGIHLIIATQRPSVDVITGLIKANMPSRIAFAVSSGVDSRTILDMNGAEKLLGKGDMLFFPQGLPKPARIQGAFVTDEEVSDVVNYIKQQNAVDAEENSRVRDQMENLASGGQIGSGDSKAQNSGNDIDDYFYRGGKAIIEKNNASIGYLQRVLRIGFNRAARLMDQLCDAGVVAESEGTKSRRILMTEAEFETYCQDNDLH